MKFSIIIQALLLIAFQGVLFSQDNLPDLPDSDKSTVDFFMEEITLQVSDSIAHVEGVYCFRNNTSKEFDFPVLFPFYTDSLSLFPHLIEAYTKTGENKQALQHKKLSKFNGVSLKIPLAAGEETVWYLDYEQKIRSKRAVYIITSTAAWKKPLEKATYYFTAPESFAGVEVWPEADTVYTENGNIIYKCERENFMPSQDMKISWK